MKCIHVTLFCLREAVSKFLSYDCPGALCTFMQPVCHFLPYAFVQLGVSCRVV